ncbi:MAG: hypothetical protein AB8F34_05440, partial [Akkermansiaceae bacterium]
RCTYLVPIGSFSASLVAALRPDFIHVISSLFGSSTWARTRDKRINSLHYLHVNKGFNGD